MHCTVVERINAGEELAGERLVAVLRRIVQALHHVRLLGHVPKQSPRRLVLVHKRQLTACLVKQNLMDHAIGAAGVDDHSVDGEPPHGDHDRQHDRVGPIEGVLLY